jgi:hypothetical protein
MRAPLHLQNEKSASAVGNIIDRDVHLVILVRRASCLRKPGLPAIKATTHAKIRTRLGGSGSLADDFPSKPKGMHWRTYHRFIIKACDAQDISEAATLKWLNAQRGKL